MNRPLSVAIAAGLLASAALLAGCGQKGPLVLPTAPLPAAAASATPSK